MEKEKEQNIWFEEEKESEVEKWGKYVKKENSSFLGAEEFFWKRKIFGLQMRTKRGKEEIILRRKINDDVNQ